MKEVYCKNCKYYILTRDAWNIKSWPECKITKTKESTFEKVKNVYGLHLSFKNKENNY